MVNHDAEGFRLVALVLHPVKALVGDEIRQIAFHPHRVARHPDEVGVVVVALSGNDFPFVEALRQTFQVPFAKDGRLIARLSQQGGKRLLRGVEHAGGVVRESVLVAVLTRQQAGPRRTAQGVGNEAVGETETVVGDAVEMGRLDIPAVVTAHHLSRVIVGHDEHDVGSLGPLRKGAHGGQKERTAQW